MSTPQQRRQAQAPPPLVPLQRQQQRQRRKMQQQDQRTLCARMVRDVLVATRTALMMTNEDHVMTDEEQQELERVVEACPLNEHARVWADRLVEMGDEALNWLWKDYEMQGASFNQPQLAMDDRGALCFPLQIVVTRFRPLDDAQAHFRNVVALLKREAVRGDPELLVRAAHEPLRTWFRANAQTIERLIMNWTWAEHERGLVTTVTGVNTRVVTQVLLRLLRFFHDNRASEADLRRFKLFDSDDPHGSVFSIFNDALVINA